MTTMTFNDVMDSASGMFDSFNIFELGLAVVWIIGSFFLANAITERKDEKVLTMLMLVMFGGIIFFADDPAKYVFLIIAVLIAVYGLFKILWKNKIEYNR